MINQLINESESQKCSRYIKISEGRRNGKEWRTGSGKCVWNVFSIFSIHVTVQKLGISNFYFFLEINTFISQGCIKLLTSDSKAFYNATKDFYMK